MSPTIRRALVAGLSATAALAFAAGPALAQADPAPPQVTPEQRAAALARPAVVYLQMHYEGWVRLSDGSLLSTEPYVFDATCTGFVVNPSGYVATAGHCVDDTSSTGAAAEFLAMAAAEAAELIPETPFEEWLGIAQSSWTVEGLEANSPVEREVSVITGAGTGNSLEGAAVPAQVVEFRPIDQGDVALLKIEARDLPAVDLAPDADVQTGTPVLSIGYPGSTEEVTDPSLEPTFKDGQISSKTTSGSVPVYETSAALTEGMSGGPTVDMNGRVVGINSFKPAGEEQAFNFISPAAMLDEMLGRNNVQAELGPLDRTYRAGLEDYFAGFHTDAIAKFDEVLALSPGHLQAQEYKTNAARARAQFGDTPRAQPAAETGGVGSLGYLIGGGVLLAAVLVVLLVVLLRRSGRRAAARVEEPATHGPSGYGSGGYGSGGYGSGGYGSGGYGSGGYGPGGYGLGPGAPPDVGYPVVGIPTQADGAPPRVPYGSNPGPPSPPVGFPVVAPAQQPVTPSGGMSQHGRAAPSWPDTDRTLTVRDAGASNGGGSCPHCGAPRTPGARFCSGCGSALS